MNTNRRYQTVLAAMAVLTMALSGVGCGEDVDDANNEFSARKSALDPAPDKNEPGEYPCEGCPTSNITNFEFNLGGVTANDFQGSTELAEGNGTYYIGSSAGELVGPIETDPETGDFSFTAPLFCGEQLVKCLWSNDEGTYVLVTRVVTEDCVEPDIRITLSWDGLGDDFELHLIKEGGSINDDATDCTWTSCVGQGPDWGVEGDSSDNPRKDVDNTGTYGPENIYLSQPEPGLYTIMVEHWGTGEPEADGQVIFNVDGKTRVADVENLAPKSVWTVGTIEWPSAEIQLSTDIYDCSGDWSDGCRAELP